MGGTLAGHHVSIMNILLGTLPSFPQEVYFNMLYAFRILVYVNSAINPVLYNVTSSKFRGAFFR